MPFSRAAKVKVTLAIIYIKLPFPRSVSPVSFSLRLSKDENISQEIMYTVHATIILKQQLS